MGPDRSGPVESPTNCPPSQHSSPTILTTPPPHANAIPTVTQQWARFFSRSTSEPSTHNQDPARITASLSDENLRNNVHWGDPLTQQKDPTHTRIYCQNVNGFKLDPEGGQFSSFCKIHQEIQADISCCQELNLDTTQHPVSAIMHKTIKRHWQRSRLSMGSSPIPFSSQYKPGGTMIMATGSVTGRIQQAGKDPWGRWSHQTLIGHNGRLVTIISAYQPVAASQDR